MASRYEVMDLLGVVNADYRHDAHRYKNCVGRNQVLEDVFAAHKSLLER